MFCRFCKIPWLISSRLRSIILLLLPQLNPKRYILSIQYFLVFVFVPILCQIGYKPSIKEPAFSIAFPSLPAQRYTQQRNRYNRKQSTCHNASRCQPHIRIIFFRKNSCQACRRHSGKHHGNAHKERVYLTKP